MNYTPSIRRFMLYQIFLSDLSLSRQDLMREFNISSRTLDRDISEIRNALSEMTTFTYQLPVRNLIYDSRVNWKIKFQSIHPKTGT